MEIKRINKLEEKLSSTKKTLRRKKSAETLASLSSNKTQSSLKYDTTFNLKHQKSNFPAVKRTLAFSTS